MFFLDGSGSFEGRNKTVDSMSSVAEKCLRMRINEASLDLTSEGLLGKKPCRDIMIGSWGISADARHRRSCKHG